MKSFLLVMLVLMAADSRAQNWNPLGPVGVKRYFVNKDGYLRGMRVDSVRVAANGDSVWHPFKTPRGNTSFQTPFDMAGASWLGNSPRSDANGSWMFTNFFGDTVVIKTRVGLGATWRFYDDSGTVHYNATLTALDTQTVLGSLDSVKTILLTAAVSGGPMPNDSLHGWTITLSKTHGFVRVPDLYAWPYRRPNQPYALIDFYTSAITMQELSLGFDSSNLRALQFGLTAYDEPRRNTIYTWQGGDIFSYQYKEEPFNGGPNPGQANGHILDSIQSRTQLPWGHQLGVSRWQWFQLPSSTGLYWVQNNYQQTRSFDSTFVYGTLLLPEEAPSGVIVHYSPNDSSYGKRSTAWLISSELYSASLLYPIGFVSALEETFKEGLGLVRSRHIAGMRKELDMTAWQTGGLQWRTQNVPLAVSEPPLSGTPLAISPNPASTTLRIHHPATTLTFTFTDVTGHTVHTAQADHHATATDVDVSTLPSGLYSLAAIASDGSRHTQKILIAR